MASRSLSCLRCGGTMHEGFVIDEGAYGTIKPQKWVEGAPKYSIWTGLKLWRKQRLQIVTCRCDKCGYLESYA